MKKRSKRASTLVQIIFGFAIIVTMLIVQNSINKQRSNEYEDIDESDGINCIVENVITKKGFSFITSEDKEKFLLHSSQNRNYKDEYLSENIFVGDSIVKRSGSDTIRVYRGSQQVFFVHKQVIIGNHY